MSQIIFFPVRNPQEKLAKLCSIAKAHFDRKDPLLLMAQDEKARSFVDELLWKMPPDSFLPHTATDIPCSDIIVVTSSRDNINQARSIFNLTQSPLFIPDLTIYEFQGESEVKYKAYREKGIPIQIL